MRLIEMAVGTGAIGFVPGYAGPQKSEKAMSLARQRAQAKLKNKKKIEETAHKYGKEEL